VLTPGSRIGLKVFAAFRFDDHVNVTLSSNGQLVHPPLHSTARGVTAVRAVGAWTRAVACALTVTPKIPVSAPKNPGTGCEARTAIAAEPGEEPADVRTTVPALVKLGQFWFA
jgi:hypothetical protein